MNEKEKTMLNIGLIGQQNCGKTCFANKLVNNIFNKDQPSTIGISFTFKELDDEKLQIKFYDFSGNEKYKSFINSNCKKLDAIIFIYDTTKKFPKNYFLETIKDIEEIIRQKEDEKHIIYFMIGTKKAILEERVVSFDEVNIFCKENKINYFEEIDSKETEQEVLLNYIKIIANIIMKKEDKKGVKARYLCYYNDNNGDNQKYTINEKIKGKKLKSRNKEKNDCFIF